MYPKGTRLTSRSGRPLYEKISEENCGLWVSLTSTYTVEIEKGVYEVFPEDIKPLFKDDGSLNRFGWKWPDEQVYQEYHGRNYIVPPSTTYGGHIIEYMHDGKLFYGQVTMPNGDIISAVGTIYRQARLLTKTALENYLRQQQIKHG